MCQAVESFWAVGASDESVDYAARALELGGQIAMPASPVGAMGRMGLIADPTGAVVGLFEYLGGESS